ncbi:MAG: general secretion pathway protein GspB [Gammaproteobacteria bacterium]|nr:general secretion pathway protein GspB [Gammaproteobacteria bacterium]
MCLGSHASYAEFYDPMKPSSSRMIVHAIYLSNKKKVAIINGVRYSEKDYVNGWMVKEINSHSVVLDSNGETVRLSLAQSFFKDE